jgi:hypothetical protein
LTGEIDLGFEPGNPQERIGQRDRAVRERDEERNCERAERRESNGRIIDFEDGVRLVSPTGGERGHPA